MANSKAKTKASGDKGDGKAKKSKKDAPPQNTVVEWVKSIAIAGLLFVYLWVRATFPRYRYDQLMRLGWKVFLPLSLAAVVGYSGALVAFDWVPR